MTPRGPKPSSGGVRLFARALLALFFRRVEVTGSENLPAAGGGLLLAWHPNGLIDPALLLATFPGRVVFGARHGLFRWPLLGRVLAACAVPIFRRQDLPPDGDEARLRQGNDASLAALAAAVHAGAFAVLFPEGDSHDEPRPLEERGQRLPLLVEARDDHTVGQLGAADHGDDAVVVELRGEALHLLQATLGADAAQAVVPQVDDAGSLTLGHPQRRRELVVHVGDQGPVADGLSRFEGHLRPDGRPKSRRSDKTLGSVT